MATIAQPIDASGVSAVDSHKHSLPTLMLGAIGVVYGDIGTSPLYTMKESFLGPHPLAVDPLHIFGVLSLIFWTLMMVVTLKYVSVAMRADNRGEGGSFALLALIARNLEARKRWTSTLIMLGVAATCLFYGDAMITPAISVLSAVEGLTIVQAQLQPVVVPISIGILVGEFELLYVGICDDRENFRSTLFFRHGSNTQVTILNRFFNHLAHLTAIAEIFCALIVNELKIFFEMFFRAGIEFEIFFLQQ